jgi:hypothetical protein
MSAIGNRHSAGVRSTAARQIVAREREADDQVVDIYRAIGHRHRLVW